MGERVSLAFDVGAIFEEQQLAREARTFALSASVKLILEEDYYGNKNDA